MIIIISDKDRPAIKNLIDWLGHDFEFYCIPQNISSKDALQKALSSKPYDLIYVAGVNHQLSKWAVDLHRDGKIPQKPLVIAPYGDLDHWRGSILLNRLFGKYRDVTWLAAHDFEFESILNAFPSALHQVQVMPHLGMKTPPPRPHPRSKSGNNPLRIAFDADIHKQSNLDDALVALSGITGDVIFDIYGKKQDDGYWRRCESIISKLPPNITATYQGETQDLINTLESYHLFYLPTTDTHRIWQALYAGCLVLTDYQPDWIDIERYGLGWMAAPDERDIAQSAIQEMVEMPDLLFYHLSEMSQQLARRTTINPEALETNRKLLQSLVQHDSDNR